MKFFKIIFNTLLFRVTSIVLIGLLNLLGVQIQPVVAEPNNSPCTSSNPQLAQPWCIPTTLTLSSTDADQEQYEYYDFIWRTFIALNWPNVPITVEGNQIVEGFRGEPDPTINILEQQGTGRLKQSVWENYREPGSEIFIPPQNWDNYPEWNTPRPPLADKQNNQRHLKNFDGLVEYAADINQPYFYPNFTGPLIDQAGNFVRYEVATNQAFFTYIQHSRYYDTQQQKDDVARSIEKPKDKQAGFKRPPYGDESYLRNLKPFAKQGFIDVKAAWRELNEDDPLDRYLHRTLVVDQQGTQKMMGLVALHVFRYTLIDQNGKITPGYVGATFEQVDNVESSPGIKPSFNTGAKPSEVQKTFGFSGDIPAIASKDNPKPQSPVSIYRVTPIPGSNVYCPPPNQTQKCPPALSVAAVNAKYQEQLQPSVFSHYQLIGTQNKRPDRPLDFSNPSNRQFNGHEGPITGVYANTNNLINTALESYTQQNFSCILCHSQARPQGVPEKAFEDDRFKIITFMLNMAHAK